MLLLQNVTTEKVCEKFEADTSHYNYPRIR